jgi:hypothetical protein
LQHKEEIMAENEQTNSPAPQAAEAAKRIAELEGLLAGKTEELTKAGTRLAELEASASSAAAAAVAAVSRYKAVIVQSNPDVLPELISGETIEALDGSLAKARDLIEKVKKNLEAKKAADRVPAGAPPRGAADTSGLSSREKISQGVEKARGK